MASDTEVPELSSVLERLLRRRDLSLFMPFLLGFTNAHSREDPQDPDQESPETTSSRDRIILINPFTQGMVVIEGTSSLDSLLNELGAKDGQPPASKASIEAMPCVEIGSEEEECVICLEEFGVNGLARAMPCKHRFHGNCIEKWLGIHGSCPVCRYKMPVDEEEVGKKRDGEEGERERRRVEREIWVSFSINGSWRSGDSNQTPSVDSNDSVDGSVSSPGSDQELGR